MPTCVLTCEACSNRRPFLLYEEEVAEAREKPELLKQWVDEGYISVVERIRIE